jgi:DNA-directed RNA polymerase subunit beta'
VLRRQRRARSIKLPNGVEARYFLPVDAILSVDRRREVRPATCSRVSRREGAKTRDITGGLPRVAELFEARKPKDHAIIAEIDGRVEFGKDYKNKRRVVVVPPKMALEPVEYLIPKGKHIAVQEGDFVQEGRPADGRQPGAARHPGVMGVEALANYLVNEIQEVYRLQGVKINDKHIEVIVRQMLQKVEITDGGDTTFLAGRTGRPRGVRRGERQARSKAGRKPAGQGAQAGAARHHQGLAADPLVHLGGLVPGNHPRAHRSGGPARSTRSKASRRTSSSAA